MYLRILMNQLNTRGNSFRWLRILQMLLPTLRGLHSRRHRKFIRNAFKMLYITLSFAYEISLCTNTWPNLVFPGGFAVDANTIAKFWICISDKFFGLTKPSDLMGCQILSFVFKFGCPTIACDILNLQLDFFSSLIHPKMITLRKDCEWIWMMYNGAVWRASRTTTPTQKAARNDAHSI